MTARYAKLKFTAPVPATGTATGSVFLDGVAAYNPPGLVNPVSFFKRGWLAMAQGSTLYGCAVGAAGSGTEADGEAYVWEPMTLSGLQAAASGAVPAANSAVFTVRKNGADTALTCTIGAGATAASDVAHSVDFSRGDRFALKIVSSAAAGTNDYKASLKATLLDSAIGLPYLQFSGSLLGSPSIYGEANAANVTNEVQKAVPLPRCLITYPIVVVRPNDSEIMTINRNATVLPARWSLDGAAAATAQLLEIPEFLYADMDLLTCQKTTSTNPGGNAVIKLKRTAGASYDPCPALFSSLNQAQATTFYMGGYGSAQNATENKVQVPMPNCTVKNLRASADAAPPAGQTITLTLRKNGVDTTLTSQITSAGRPAFDLSGSHAVVFAAGDLLSIKCVTSATTGTKYTNASVEAFV